MSPVQRSTIHATLAAITALWVGVALGRIAWDAREGLMVATAGTLGLIVGGGIVFRRQERDLILEHALHGPTYCPQCQRAETTEEREFDDPDHECWQG